MEYTHADRKIGICKEPTCEKISLSILEDGANSWLFTPQ
jgi:hypothetical protein